MCTLVVAHRSRADAPVVVLANRDEFLARPSLAPKVRLGTPTVFCGLDAKEGGTWFGINAYGLVVGLTNLTLRSPDPALRSRGLLCVDMLRCRDAAQAANALRDLESDAYNPFNMVVLDADVAVRVRYDRAPQIEVLEPGVHATTNWPVDWEQDGKRRGVEARVRGLMSETLTSKQLLQELRFEAARHESGGDPQASVCCHATGYGTRASTILLLDSTRGRVHVEHADGPACTTEFVDHSADVAAMLRFEDFRYD